MKTTGFKLIAALEQWKLKLELANSEWADSLTAFDGETKTSPKDILATIIKAERACVKLQVAQAEYNAHVRCEVPHWSKFDVKLNMSLHEAVKLVGAAGRIQKLIKGAASTKSDPYSNTLYRDPNQMVAKATISRTEAAKDVATVSKWVRSLKSAIAEKNSTEVELNLDSKLFE
jgi:alpha-D-ribose 1-methylphosphonate 5-triphosphate diphosphatase PhnM